MPLCGSADLAAVAAGVAKDAQTAIVAAGHKFTPRRRVVHVHDGRREVLRQGMLRSLEAPQCHGACTDAMYLRDMPGTPAYSHVHNLMSIACSW